MSKRAFLKVRVHDEKNSPTVRGLCLCFEDEEWRGPQYIQHLVKKHLINFIFPPEEASKVTSENAMDAVCKAAELVYKSEKYENRGELGELILFSIMAEHFGAKPLISKFYYKTHSNDTVKGFDSVHVVGSADSPQLWLGEVKFYKRRGDAITDVVEELADHFKSAYLRSEFMLIDNKINGDDDLIRSVRELIDNANSLDDIKASLHVPVFLTYESKLFNKHNCSSEAFKQAFSDEIATGYKNFTGKDLPKNINIHLILVPLKEKKILVDEFDKRIKLLQAI